MEINAVANDTERGLCVRRLKSYTSLVLLGMKARDQGERVSMITVSGVWS